MSDNTIATATDAVRCPRCQRLVVPNPDGTLPGHQIQPGPQRAPICRFRGAVEIGAGA